MFRIILFLVVFTFAADYEYKGFYYLADIFQNVCNNCTLDLPAEYLHQEIFLNVSTNKKQELYNALVKASKSLGWELRISKKAVSAEPLRNQENIPFISCLDNVVLNVPRFLYGLERKADSIKCAKRDSLNFYQDSLKNLEKNKNDSLANLPPLTFSGYTLKYFNFNKSFSDKMGVSWSDVLWTGTLKNVSFLDSWSASAVEMNDTSFSFRSVNFALDSSIVLNWGSEEQTQLKTYANDGIMTTEYEWRKYGLEISIKKDDRRVKMEYVFREKDAVTTILSGSVVGSIGDTLVINGDYVLKREINTGVPLLSDIPIVRLFFAHQEFIKDYRKFYIYLIPKRG